jgi:hypothetical protein
VETENLTPSTKAQPKNNHEVTIFLQTSPSPLPMKFCERSEQNLVETENLKDERTP